MDKAIDYIFMRIEKSYYELNPDLLGKNYCIQDDELPCNCITGIIMNYAGYIAGGCLDKPKYSKYSNGIKTEEWGAYVHTKFCSESLCPVVWPGGNYKFHLMKQACKKGRTKGNEVYFPFRNYQTSEELTKKIESNQYNAQALAVADRYRLELWILFLRAIRVKTPEIRQKALLTMAIFTFPAKTLTLILDFLKSKGPEDMEKKKLKGFIDEYKSFLNKLGTCQSNFLFHFSKEFENMTKVSVAKFIEDINDNAPDISLLQTLWSSYNRNVQEMKKRGLFREIEKVA